MSIKDIANNLTATNAYGKIGSKQFADAGKAANGGVDVSFGKMVKGYYDSSPNQILQAIRNVNNPNFNTSNSQFSPDLLKSIQSLRNNLHKSERTNEKALNKEASLLEVATNSAKAETVLQTTVALRDKFIAAYNDIIKMQI